MRNLKQEIDKLQEEVRTHAPLTAEEFASLRKYYLIRFTYATNALAGSALTLDETRILLEEDLTPAGKPVKDTLLTVGHKKAYALMASLQGKKLIEESDVKRLHRLLFEQLDPEHAGEYRTQKAFVAGSVYPTALPEKIPALMTNLFKHLKEERPKLHPVIFAAKLHKKFSFIYPFAYGNGQMARLLLNLALLQAGYPLVVITPASRMEYNAALEKAHKTPYAFAQFIGERVILAQRDFLRLIH